MAPPLACPAPASGGRAARGRRSCGRIWIRCSGHPVRGHRALEAAIPDQATLGPERSSPGRLRRAGGGCVCREGRPNHLGPRLELLQLVQFVAKQHAGKGSQAPSNYTKQCGLQVPKHSTHTSPKSTITSSHANPVRGHGIGQQDEFLETDQASAFILQRWPREVWSHSRCLGPSSNLARRSSKQRKKKTK